MSSQRPSIVVVVVDDDDWVRPFDTLQIILPGVNYHSKTVYGLAPRQFTSIRLAVKFVNFSYFYPIQFQFLPTSLAFLPRG